MIQLSNQQNRPFTTDDNSRKPANPNVWQGGSVLEAWQYAKDQVTPVFVPEKYFCDDRGWSLMNQLQGVMSEQGQLNYSEVYPAVVKAWHRHRLQTDFWICTRGHVKAGIYDENNRKSWMMVMGTRRPGVLIIPPPLWHGLATVGHEPSGLLYYVTHAYNPSAPDEERRPFDSVEGFSWETMNM